jgi:serine/threonine protein kinase/Tfp pilus assembly protein PilF
VVRSAAVRAMSRAADPVSLNEAVAVLREALDHDDASEREAFLDLRCAGRPALRARVQSLLDGCAAELDTPAEPAADALIGTRLGAFRVVERIGRGGTGVIYRGRREGADFAQEVAIKLIRRGFDFDDVQARFLRERRILARLSHPNLARFIDGGVSAERRPWFALEFVHGTTITRWCDAHRLGIRARIALFLEVCAAVQYAHGQLVVHRDLKPGNVLVDETGTVRLLDFGIAGLLGGDEPATAATTIGQRRALTPEYAAPEQFRGEVAGLAVDVYALGVIAYELVGGVLPYPVDRADPAAAERSVCETPPQALTAAIARADAGGTSGAQRLVLRGETPASYRRAVRGDLSRILEKALAKAPTRRYATVDAFAEDLRRWQAGQAVRVSGNGWAYRTATFVRRHRLPVALAAAVLVALLTGIGGVLWKSRQAVLAAERANSIQAFLLSVFDASTPGGAADRVPTTRELLARGVARVQDEMSRQPALQADLLTTFGRIHNQLNLFVEAEPLLRQALDLQQSVGGTDAARAETLYQLARALKELRRYGEARALLDRALLAAPARATSQQADIRALRGIVLAQDGAPDAGAGELRVALVLLGEVESPPGRRTASMLDEFGYVLTQGRRFDEAVEVYRRALALERSVYGPVHADIGMTLSNLGACLLSMGRLEQAEQAMREAVAVDGQVYRAPHRVHAVHLSNLASVLLRRGGTVEATELFRESLRLRSALYGDHDPEAAKAMSNLGGALVQLERYNEALALLDQAAAVLSEANGDWRYWLANVQSNRARAERGAGHPGRAEASARQALALREALGGRPGEELFNTRAALGAAWLDSGRLAEAQALFATLLADSERVLPADHPSLAVRHLALADADRTLGLLEEARMHYERSLQIGLATGGERAPYVIEARLGLADTLHRLGQSSEAERQREAAAQAAADLPETHSLRRRAALAGPRAA